MQHVVKQQIGIFGKRGITESDFHLPVIFRGCLDKSRFHVNSPGHDVSNDHVSNVIRDVPEVCGVLKLYFQFTGERETVCRDFKFLEIRFRERVSLEHL